MSHKPIPTLNSSNAGFGTSTPNERLTVSGNISASGNVTGSNLVYNGGNSDGASLLIGTNDAQSLNLETNGLTRFTVTSGGNLGIGTTTPTARLDILDTTSAVGGALSGSALRINQTWNTTGAPTAIKLNVTDTASNAASLLMDLQVGEVSQFSVSKNAVVNSNAGYSVFGVTPANGVSSGIGWNSSNHLVLFHNSTPRMVIISTGATIASDASYSWSSSTTPTNSTRDLSLFRDNANTLAQRNGLNTQSFRLYNTFSSSTNFERLDLRWDANVAKIGTQKGSAGGVARDFALETDSVERLRITNFGDVGIGKTNPVCRLDIAETWDSGILITGASGTGTAATITFAALPTGIAVGTSIIVAGINPTGYNGTFTVTASTTTSVTYNNSTTATYVSGGAINHPITGASGTGTIATVTFRAMPAAIPVGSTVVIANINPSGYNGTFIVTASTTTSVSYTNATTATYVGGGNIQQRYTALNVDVTDTASNTNSLLADFRVGGTSRFRVSKNGQLITPDSGSYNSAKPGYSDGSAGIIIPAGNTGLHLSENTNCRLGRFDRHYISIASNSSTDVGNLSLFTGITLLWSLFADAANTLAQRNGTNAQIFRVYNTFSARGVGTTNLETLEIKGVAASNFIIQSMRGSAGGTARDIELRHGAIDTNGVITNGTLVASVKSTGLETTNLSASGDVEITDTTKGVILKSPNGTRYRVTVDDTGALITTAVV